MERAGQVAGAVGGAGLLGATFVPWAGRGAGSSIALVRVADLVLAGTVDAWVPRPAGLVVYAIPLGGALLLLGAGLGGRGGAALALAGVVLAGTGTALALVALDRLGRPGLGPGSIVALAAAAAGTASAVLTAVAARPAGGGRTPRTGFDPAPGGQCYRAPDRDDGGAATDHDPEAPRT